MGDLFHPGVSDEWRAKVFDVMMDVPRHTYILLTKRPALALAWLARCPDYAAPWPPHVWFGVTAEDQPRANQRIPLLLQVPAAVRIVSAEPLLGPLTIRQWLWAWEQGLRGPFKLPQHAIHWVICGGETGPGGRVMEPEWARSLRDEVVGAGIPFYFKQWGQFQPGVHKQHGSRQLDGKFWVETP